MSSISNVFNSLGPNSNQRLSSQKPYEETHYPYGIFVRNYKNNIIGFGSTHFHYSNNAQEKASIKQTIHLILDQLKPGAMVLLEGGGSLDTTNHLNEEVRNHLLNLQDSSEMLYAFLKVDELKSNYGKDINAMFPEPDFSKQIDFLIDCKVPAKLIFSFLTMRNIPQVLNEMARLSGGSINQNDAKFESVDDFIDASLKAFTIDGLELTSAPSFQLTDLLENIKKLENADEFSDILQDNGQQKPTKALLKTAFDYAQEHMPSVDLIPIIKNSDEANNFTAPINENNLNHRNLKNLQDSLKILPMNRATTIELSNKLEDQARPILDEMRSQLYSYETAEGYIDDKVSAFNVISSMLNVCREDGIKNKLSELSQLPKVQRPQVLVMFGSGHIRSLHSYFLDQD